MIETREVNLHIMNVLRITPKAARVNAQLSQKEAANAFGIDVSTLRRYENGRTVPSWDIVEKMESLYAISKDHIFFRSKTALSDKNYDKNPRHE